MSHQVDQAAVMHKETVESDTGAKNAISQIQLVEEKKPEVTIKTSDIQLVMNATHLTRQAVVELIQNAEGDVPQALRNYVTK
jgi:NACalpha-BTF3-like transcription factor